MANSISDTIRLHNGVQMPVLGLGTWQAAEGQQVEQAIHAAFELGYRHIDTAAVYGNEAGVGRAVRDSGIPRDQVFVTSKVSNDAQRAGYDAVLRACDQTLECLAMDYVDLYLVHWPVKGKYHEAWRAMERIHTDGRAKAIGVSNFLVHHLEDLLAQTQTVPTVNQVEFHPRLLQRELLEFCHAHQIVEEAWAPLMQGRGANITELQEIAAHHGKTVAQVLLRWDLQHGIVTIPKSVRRERLAENADLFDFQLSPEEMARIDGLDRHERIGADPDNVTF
jgi:diketogulonate reductase-like aldo/keto reductase